MEGVGVSDCDTIPSNFQKEHPEFDVYNLGVRANLLAFEEAKLKNGQTLPEGSTLIFFDGLNENYWDDVDLNKKLKSKNNKDKSTIDRLKDILRNSGTLWVLRGIFKNDQKVTGKDIELICKPLFSSDIKVTTIIKDTSHRIADRYLEAVDRIGRYCESNSFQCLFFLQPVPSYKYSNSLYFYNTTGGFSNRQMEYENFVKVAVESQSVIDLSHILQGLPKAYVDKLHYSATANALISKAIYDNIIRIKSIDGK